MLCSLSALFPMSFLATAIMPALRWTPGWASCGRVGTILREERHFLADDLEVIPTPGHTPGAMSFLWTKGGRRFLFIGDTLVPIDGRWDFWVTRPNIAKMRATAEMLRGIAFDTILSNSFACVPIAWFDQTPEERDELLRGVIARLG